MGASPRLASSAQGFGPAKSSQTIRSLSIHAEKRAIRQ
jgi:hypothetical protein